MQLLPRRPCASGHAHRPLGDVIRPLVRLHRGWLLTHPAATKHIYHIYHIYTFPQHCAQAAIPQLPVSLGGDTDTLDQISQGYAGEILSLFPAEITKAESTQMPRNKLDSFWWTHPKGKNSAGFSSASAHSDCVPEHPAAGWAPGQRCARPRLLQPKQGVVQGAGEEGQRVEEGTHSSQQVVGQQFRWAAHNRDRGEQKYDHTLHQPPLQCRDNTAPQSSRAAAASSSNLLAWDRLQQLCPPKDAGWARQDLPGVLMTNRAKLPLVSCQHRCAGVMGPLHPHGQRGLQDRGEVSP